MYFLFRRIILSEIQFIRKKTCRFLDKARKMDYVYEKRQKPVSVGISSRISVFFVIYLDNVFFLCNCMDYLLKITFLPLLVT